MKISVCIPTYNQAQYLQIAVNSAAKQTLAPYEIIVSNDCSTDDTQEALRVLSLQVPTLKVINQPVNLGIAQNTNACLKAATGDLIVRLDSDDYLADNYCQVLSGLLTQFPEAGYAHGNVKEIDQHGNPLSDRTLFRKEIFQNSNDALIAAAKGYRVAANIIMFRRSALESVDYTTNRPNYVEDYHLSADLAKNGWGNAFSSEYLSYYRVWVDQGKVRQKRKLMEIVGLYRVFNEILEPAYTQKGLNKQPLQSSRQNLACRQADCLAWEVYNEAEKQELAGAVLQLCNTERTKRYIWCYRNGYGWLVDFIPGLQRKLRRAAVQLIKRK